MSVFTCGLLIVRSADLSDPVILPGDLNIAPAPGMQFNPRVARGGNNYLAVWADNRTVINGQISGIGAPTTGTGRGTLDDIYAARLDASGNVIDQLPIIVAGGQYNQGLPHVAWNGQNWLVVWHTQRETDPFYTDIRAARVAPDGTVLDTTPLLIRQGDSNDAYPSAVVSDGTNWVVMWEGFPSGIFDRAVFVSRVSPTGQVLDPNGKVVYQHPSQFLGAPDIAFGGDGFLLTFVDISGGPNFENVLYGVKLNQNLDLNNNAFQISPQSTPVGSANPQVAFNGQYYMAVWESGFAQTTHNPLVGSRISTDGALLDQAPIQIVADMDSYTPQLDVCGDSNAWFASYDSSNGTTGSHIRVARLSADGTPLDPNGISVSPGSRAAVANGVNGGAQVVFHNPSFDPTYTTTHVEGANVSSAGLVGPAVPISLGNPRQTRPRIARGTNGYMAVFRSEVGNDSRILVQRLDANSTPIDAEPILIASGSPTNSNPSIAFNGAFYLVVWQTRVVTQTSNSWQTLGRRVTPEGVVIDAVPIPIMTGETPDVAALGETFLVTNAIQVTSQKRHVQYIRVSGTTGLPQGTPTKVDFSFSFVPRVAAFGNRWLIVWEHHANHDDSPGTIYGAFVAPDGITLGSFVAGGTVGNDASPHLAVAGETALIVWSNGEIIGRRINSDGSFPDPPGGYTLVAAANRQDLPAVAWDGAQYILTWVDQRNETYPIQPRGDIFGARVSPTNIVLEEFTIAATQLPEDMPFVTASNGFSTFAYAKFYDNAPYKTHRITLQTAQFAPPDLGTIPAAPTNLVVTEPTVGLNVLTWTDNSDNERGFKIEYKSGPTAAWAQIAVVGPDTTTYENNVSPGGPAYLYRVRAYGLAGDSAYTNEAAATNVPPSVSITFPADGATYRAPALISVNATASDGNGTVTQVEFFSGSVSWGKDTTAPYGITRSNVAAGSYVIRAVATDNRGAMTTSAAVNITVTPQNNQLIWSQAYDNQSIIGPSMKTLAGHTGAPVDKEVADDFDIVGTVERVFMNGYRDFNATPNPTVHGIYVRFYQWQNGLPGALQAEHFIPAGSPNLGYDAASPGFFDVTLPMAFNATGKHFMSAQLVTDNNHWYWLSSRSGNARNSTTQLRDNLGTGLWTQANNSDGVFSLYGTLTGTARIDSLSAASITRSGRLTINGANFGGTQDTSRVIIGGANAIVSSWSDSAIVVYVPETAAIGTVAVQVETTNGLSNAVNLNVTARQQNGRIKWRFTAEGYIWQSAATAPDGSVYFIDSRGRLYALSADGGLRWTTQAGRVSTDGHLSVGNDGTIYVASYAQPGGTGTPFVGAVLALNPNGTEKWRFIAPESSGVTVGPDVGPDGKVYVIFKPPSGTTPTLNLVALTPDTGQLVWNYYDRYGFTSTNGKQFAFDGQLGMLYFQSLSLTIQSGGGLYAHRLDTGAREHAVSAFNGHVVAAPDHTVHNSTRSYSPQLTVNWTIPLFGQGPTNLHDVGPDSVHYLVQNYYRLYAINPDGTEKWRFDDCVSGQSCRQLDDPVASPTNHVVFAPGLLTFGQPGYFLGLNPANGAELWRVFLPTEPGYGEYGQVRPMNRAVFSRDGQTAYVSTDIANNFTFCYFYAVDTSPTLPCAVTLSPEARNHPANGGNATFNVSATSSDCNWTATSNAEWITIISGSPGVGNGTVGYNVAANTSTEQRSATITVSGQVFTVTQAGVLPNSPTVTINTPVNNSQFRQPVNIFVGADAAAAEGRTIARVEFYAGTTLIGTDTTAPYLISWNNPATTSYALTARAIDNLGIATDSAPVYITLLPPQDPELMPLPVPPPVVTNPTAEATYTAPATITIEATRQPSNYPTVRMEFYIGTTLVGTDDTAPYSLTLPDVGPGRYSISVRNVASTGARATSQPIDITVNGESFSINGRIVDNEGNPLAGVPVVLNGSNLPNRVVLSASRSVVHRNLAQSGSFTVNTDAQGNYAFTSLPEGSDYTVTPEASGIAFVPAQAAFDSLHSDQSATFIAGGNEPQAQRAQVSDFDGDRRTDIAVWQGASGIWHIVNTGNGATRLQQWGQSSLDDQAVPGDYDGDGKIDIAIFRPSDGNWYILSSSTGASTIQNWGQAGDRPCPADFDGDGLTDVAVYRPSEGNWYIKKSSGGSIAQNWGDPTDRLVPGDFDDDGRADIAVWRPSEGNWYVLKSTGGSHRENWGVFGDRPVVGDYDGDGQSDFAVFRPSEGNWYIKKSSGGNIIRNWGDSTDRPVPGDYDGDGLTDMAVWRPAEGTWYIINSSTNTATQQFLGYVGDIPIPAAYVP